MIGKAKLKKLAEKATPGPWAASDKHDDAIVNPDASRLRVPLYPDAFHNYSGTLVAESAKPNDVAFIAAASPDTILALLAELQEYERQADELDCARRMLSRIKSRLHPLLQPNQMELEIEEWATEALKKLG
jgi:Ead/Ea22-like protein